MKGYSGINDNGCIATLCKVDNTGTLLPVVNNWSNCVEHHLKTVQVYDSPRALQSTFPARLESACIIIQLGYTL